MKTRAVLTFWPGHTVRQELQEGPVAAESCDGTAIGWPLLSAQWSSGLRRRVFISSKLVLPACQVQSSGPTLKTTHYRKFNSRGGFNFWTGKMLCKRFATLVIL